MADAPQPASQNTGLLTALLSSISEGVVICDADGKIESRIRELSRFPAASKIDVSLRAFEKRTRISTRFLGLEPQCPNRPGRPTIRVSQSASLADRLAPRVGFLGWPLVSYGEPRRRSRGRRGSTETTRWSIGALGPCFSSDSFLPSWVCSA